MSKHFRITAYNEEKDYSIILESNGMFNSLWDFSSYLTNKQLKIITVGDTENESTSSNITTVYSDKMILRTIEKGKPIIEKRQIDDKIRKVIKVGNFTYLK